MTSVNPSSSDGDDTADDAATNLSLDTVFEVLANRRRRFVVYSLLGTSAGIIAFEDLVAEVAGLESGALPEPGSSDRRGSIASDLHHWHLPVLEEVGIITYDDRSKVIQYDRHPLLETWAERARRDELSEGT